LASFVSAAFVLVDSFITGGSSMGFGEASTTQTAGSHYIPSKSFTNTRLGFSLKKVGSPTCNIKAQIWSVTGDHTPNVLLAESTTSIATSSLTTGYQWINFDFAGYALTGSTKYFIGVASDLTGCSGGNQPQIEYATSQTGYYVTRGSTGGGWTDTISNGRVSFKSYETTVPQPPEINITSKDYYTDASINSFNVNLTNTSGTYSLSTTNGTIVSRQDGNINLTFYSPVYTTKTYLEHDSSINIEGVLKQSEISITMKDLLNNTLSFYEWNITDNTNSKLFSTTNGSIFISPPTEINLNFSFVANTTAFKSQEHIYNFSTYDTANYNATVSYEPIVLTFVDASDLTILDNANITVYYPFSAPTFMVTDSQGKIYIDVINGLNKDIGNYTFGFGNYAGYESPINFSRTITELDLKYEETIGITAAGITVNIYDRATKTLLIGKEVDVIILGILNKTTSTGTVNIVDSTFVAGEYTIQSYADGYITEQQLITFTGQSNATLDIYMLNATGTNTALVFANIIDEFYRVQQDARVSLLEYDPNIKAFTKVSEKLSNVNGEAVFAIELNVKSYYMVATKTIGGQTYSAETNSEIFQIENEVRNLVMRFSDPFQVGITDYLIIDYNETFADNISTISFSYTTLNNFVAEVCVEYFQSFNNYDISTYLQCVNSSAAYAAVPILLNRSNNYYAKIYQKYNGNNYSINRWGYQSQYSFDSILSYNQYASGFFVLLWVLLLSVALMSKNIPLFCFGGMILTWIQFLKFPSVAMGSGSAIKTIILIFILNLSRKKEDYT